MAEIRWENDLNASIERAKKENKTVYLDLWFDG